MIAGAPNTFIVPAVATLIVLAGVIDDLRSRKFHNQLFLALTAVAFIVQVVCFGWWGLNSALIGFVAGLLAFLPLTLGGMVGAGDMKLMAALGAIIGWTIAVDVAVFSLLWGLAFGLVRIVIRGEIKTFAQNLVAIAKRQDRSKLELHRTPFTFAIFLAWLTHLAQIGVGR